MDIISSSFNVNFINVDLEGNQENTVEEEINFLHSSSMRVPFEINKLLNSY